MNQSVKFTLIALLIVVNMVKAHDDGLCSQQLQAFLHGVNASEIWALRLFDSWGRWPSGQFSGNRYDFGGYDQCDEYRYQHAEVGLITGKYCMAIVPRQLPEPENRFFIDTGGNDGVVVGLCVPRHCSEQILKEPVALLLNTMYHVNTNDVLIQCETDEDIFTFNAARITAITLFSVILALVIASTVYEIFRLGKPGKSSPVFIAFSIYSNWLSLMKTSARPANGRSNTIDCIHGVRVLAITWIIFAHTYLVYNSSPLINPIDTLRWIDSFHSTLIIAGPLSVDTFFLLSGLLIVWSQMRELDRTRFLNVPVMYLHRYIRLTPVFAALILFTVGIMPGISSGPLWSTSFALSVNQCNQYWWSALLYVQNYVNSDQICLGHSWYLSVDMQLFLISPLLIYPLWKWGKIMFIPVGLLILTSVISSFVMFMVYNLPGSVLITDINRDSLTYVPTHTRMGAWMVGVITGYIFHRNRSATVRLRKSRVVLGWTLSMVALVGIIVGTHYVNQPVAGTHPQIYDALFESLKHVVWACGVAWIIFACANGYGGPVNSVLSLRVWQPLGKLSYCLYLLHLPMQTVLTASTRTVRSFSDFRAIHTFWGEFCLTVLAAVVWTLCFEIPFGNLDALIVRKDKKSSS
ncbi:nose resistant to fluoxetine protein 6-like [Armigeres subalbatus]|uniref:nose resistant to fluoxetine protein 6-like n=1 Tax=Armigeres subalbatus TaxID=124917 RepID=UPI002ECFB8F2